MWCKVHRQTLHNQPDCLEWRSYRRWWLQHRAQCCPKGQHQQQAPGLPVPRGSHAMSSDLSAVPPGCYTTLITADRPPGVQNNPVSQLQKNSALGQCTHNWLLDLATRPIRKTTVANHLSPSGYQFATVAKKKLSGLHRAVRCQLLQFSLFESFCYGGL
jgi:hypothetical protein